MNSEGQCSANGNVPQQPGIEIGRSLESFSEIGNIEDKKKWYINSRKPAPLVRKNSVKGSQAFTFFNREFYYPKNHTEEFKKLILTWSLVSILAVIVCFVSLIVDWGVTCTFYAVYGISDSLFINPHRGDISPSQLCAGFLAFALSSAFFACLSSYLVLFHAPLAEGSGIPDVKSYLNGVHLKGLFSLPTCFAKAVGCSFSIGSGLIAGREGPLIHIGAIIGSGISQGASSVFGFRTPSWVNKHFRSAEWKRDFAVMGSAFGVSAAFIAPMGGVLFAIEEGATVWRQQLTFLTLYGAVITAFCTSLIKGYINNSNDSPIIPAVSFGSYRSDAPEIIFRASDFPYVLLIAIIGGLVGAAFSSCQQILNPLRKKYIRVSKVYTLLEVVAVSLLISSVRFWVPYVFGRCTDDKEFYLSQGDKRQIDSVPNPIPFHCEGDQTNDFGVMLWLPSEYMLKWLLHANGTEISTAHLFFSFIFFFCGAVLTFGLALTTGLFIPSFVIGGTYGRLVGQLAASSTGNYNLISSFTFLGSVSALGGITRVTISVALIALESTQNFNTSLYCFFVVIVSKLVADSFNNGIVDVVIERKEIPFLVDDLGYEAYQLSADVVMTPIQEPAEFHKRYRLNRKKSTKSLLLDTPDERRGMATVFDIETLENIRTVLVNNPNEFEFLANSKEGGLEGTIERLVIIRLLQHKLIGVDAPLLHATTLDSAWPNLRNHIAPSKEVDLLRNLSTTVDFQTSVLDLRPYIDREPAIVLNTSSMRKAHAHIRNGERNVLVAAPSSVNIIGVIKRHDIMPGTLGALLKAKKKHMLMCEKRKQQQQEEDNHNMNNENENKEDREGKEGGSVTVNDDNVNGPGMELSSLETSRQPETVLGGGSDSIATKKPYISRVLSMSSDGDSDDFVSLSPFEPRFYQLMQAYFQERQQVSELYVQSKKLKALKTTSTK